MHHPAQYEALEQAIQSDRLRAARALRPPRQRPYMLRVASRIAALAVAALVRIKKALARGRHPAEVASGRSPSGAMALSENPDPAAT